MTTELTRRACWLLLGFASFLSGCRQGSDEDSTSIHRFRDVQYATAEEWGDLHARRPPDQIGWVLLPRDSVGRPYVSGVDPFAQGFVQPQVCGECHQDVYDNFLHTAHYRTAGEATRETVLGSFADGDNELKTRLPNLSFKMVADEEGLWQYLSVKDGKQVYKHKVPMDIVTGSGNHGQSYLYWHGDGLYELPVSYFTEIDRWINSPGMYADGTADFGRGITDRCLDCHATYFAIAPGSLNRYDRTNYILGVTCVRCHGAGWAHVQYHRHHADDVSPRYIVNPAQLSRERANEVCAQCHSGAGQLLQPAFSYQPGEPLDEYVALDFSGQNPQNDDPHAANQLARLMKSRCFTETDDLTCFTCHDPHSHERGDTSLYSQRCVQCHTESDCGLHDEIGEKLAGRCVHCHMPSRRDAEGVMETATGALLPLLRDHYIQARPESTREIVERLRQELAK